MVVPAAGGFILHRLAVVVFSPPRGDEGAVGATYGAVELTTIGQWADGAGLKLLIDASSALEHRPKRTAAGLVVVPDDARRRCEQAIEATADLVSISRRCRRNLASPFQWIAFEATSDEAREWLAESVGIHELDRVVAIRSVSSEVPLDETIIDGLRDRSDGAMLCAEALAQPDVTGQFRDFFRVFERAFRRSGRLLPEPLAAFLDPRYEYRTKEIERWVQVRDGLTHADVRSRVILEADVRPVVARVQQAVYDVLFNKLKWRDASTERRELWSPAGWSDGSGVIVVKQYSEGRLEATLLDQFGAYPTDLLGVIERLPTKWWAPRVEPRSPQEPIRVIPAQ
jgi:hypothetical protein